jgi:hypothetical protein
MMAAPEPAFAECAQLAAASAGRLAIDFLRSQSIHVAISFQRTIMRRRYFTVVGYLLLATTAFAGSKPYENGRFGYVIDLPSDFRIVSTPDNGDGLGLASADGSAKLSVWGNYLTDGGFRQESDLRKGYEIDDGWTFTYEKRGTSWASLSGTKGDRIIYMRQIALCYDAMGNFRIEYPASRTKQFGPVIDRLVKSLKAPKHCD